MIKKAARDEVKPKVIQKIADKVLKDPSEIQETQRLEIDLGMTLLLRQSMADPYTKISQSFGGKPISIEGAGKLETVAASIDLVLSRANEPSGKEG